MQTTFKNTNMKHRKIKYGGGITINTEGIENQSPNSLNSPGSYQNNGNTPNNNNSTQTTNSIPKLVFNYNGPYATFNTNTSKSNLKLPLSGFASSKNSEGKKIISPQNNSKKDLKYNNNIKDKDSNNSERRHLTIENSSSSLNKIIISQNEVKANLDRVKISHKNFGIIEGYAAITTEGIVRDYNEDRVSIIFNVAKPNNFLEPPGGAPWPKCSFFGLYDGHGGSGCADFLRDNLHKYVFIFF
jgi:hypothetical protein